MYLQKVLIRKKLRRKKLFVGVSKVIDRNNRIRIRIRKSEVRICGSKSVPLPKCYGFATLIIDIR
jgi:hypothetical protein